MLSGIRKLIVGIFFLLSFIGWQGLTAVEQKLKGNLAETLKGTRASSQKALQFWVHDKKRDAEVLAAQPETRTNILNLLAYAEKKSAAAQALKETPELRWLRRHLGKACRKYGFIGFVIFDPTGLQVGALLDEPVGRRQLADRSDFFQHALEGETVVSHPFPAETPLPDLEGHWSLDRPTLFAATPVRDDAGKISGVLGFRIRPETEFTQVLNINRTGVTGETYVFNRRGTLLSGSRFEEDLKKIGLLPENQSSHLNLEIRDPGGNLLEGYRTPIPRDQQPLTRMAQSAVLGETGLDVEGYRDYRGVPVVGAWTWLPELNLGLATEMDVKEALAPLSFLRKVLLLLFSLLLISLVAAVLLRSRERGVEKKRKKTEESLRASEKELIQINQFLDSILNSHSELSIISTNLDGTILYWNRGAENLLGYTAEEMVGKKRIHRIYPEDENTQMRVQAAVEKILKTKSATSLEIEEITKSRERIWFKLALAPRFDEIGQINGFLGIGENITERKNMEETLKRNEKRSRRIIDAAPMAFISTNAKGEIREWNTKAEATFGWSRETVLGKNIAQIIIPPQLRAAHEKGLRRFLETGRGRILNTQVELSALNRAGQEFPIELSLFHLHLDNAVIFNAFIQDISERKLIQAQLTHAQKLESIGQLAAGIAHEINSPMQFIGDNARFLQDCYGDLFGLLLVCEKFLTDDDPCSFCENNLQEIRRITRESDWDYLKKEIPLALEQSLQGVQRVSRITQAMKAFSHPGSERKQPVNLNQALETTLVVSRNEWKYVAEIEKDFDPQLPPVLCLVNDINQVFLNLVVNAAHAIESRLETNGASKGIIRIATRKLEDGVEIRIEDNGMGIPPDIQNRIFDPFFTTKEVGKGTGQGLSIVHSVVVKKHRGTVSFETEPGQGTTFIVRLPFSRTEETAGAIDA